ncbi:PH domain-containing protein [Halorientalis marina]|jgi:membrane protein YdbS with pleckstrin-like domain|uniref:PH domain-containing protein n=1 Tax=Halorientalis marina TaxID=2931976 RepID=UPI001FF4C529|nr:PH domain-containing protein [Halorientalis marina]
MEALHSRIRLRWALTRLAVALVVGAVIAVVLVRFGRSPLGGAAVGGGLLAIGLVHTLLLYRSWRFAVESDALELKRGVLTRVETAVPFVRIQHVDTQRGPLDRLLGLSSVVVYTAGSRGADVTIPGLSPDRAEKLRNRLRDLAIESEPEDAV